MEFLADLHLHSCYSRATSRDLDLESLHVAAQLKGIQVLATGDATHPAWFETLKSRLVPAEPGFYRLREEVAKVCDLSVPGRCRGPVRFVLATEISNIYKKDGRTRKNHNLVFLPDFESAERFNARLSKIGNIHSDGRPILGLDARDLLEIVLETDPLAYLVPAHIWTPWFSMLGSKSGFDSLEECFGDLSGHVFAAETGLSSDPLMNWRVAGLDRLTLISNSDAHSPAKLGREANRFNTEFSFTGIRRAIEDRREGDFLGTIEFFPQEGKYHLDGHRACQVCLTPPEARRLHGICPVCHRPMTLGVLHRVEDLADRPEGFILPGGAPFENIVPLCDLLADTLRCGAGSKKVLSLYRQALDRLGSELDILMRLDFQTIATADIPLLAEAVERMRRGQIAIDGGYDGDYGKIRIFAPGERRRILGQKSLFSLPGPISEKTPVPEEGPALAQRFLFDAGKPSDGVCETVGLNEAQQLAVEAPEATLILVAGPGTGKTFTLTRRIARLIETEKVPAGRILAVTFTRKAADAMRRRIAARLGQGLQMPEIGTFHGLCAKFLGQLDPSRSLKVVDDIQRLALIRDAILQAVGTEGQRPFSARQAAQWIRETKQAQSDCESRETHDFRQRCFLSVFDAYQRLLAVDGLCDFEDLIFCMLRVLESDAVGARQIRDRFSHVFVDEFQDINPAQYRLVCALVPPDGNLCAIGDPDQCIYGFRGSDPGCMAQLRRDFPDARVIRLNRSYRTPQRILDAAGQVIAAGYPDHPRVRLEATCPGAVVALMRVESEKAEAVAIGRIIERMVGGSGFESINFGAVEEESRSGERSFADFAVLFRTHTQGRIIYETLEAAGIPCQLASRRFLTEDPAVAGLTALLRVVTGVGGLIDLGPSLAWLTEAPGVDSINCFKHWCYRRGFSLHQGIQQVARLPIDGLSVQRQRRLVKAVECLKAIKIATDGLPLAARVDALVKMTKLCHTLLPLPDPLARLVDDCRDETGFLNRLPMLTDTDIFDERAERVALMSLHAAKGLEFNVVFIAGCEEGLIPLKRPGRVTDLAEERRLFYVGLTRARQALYLCAAGRRSIQGKTTERRASAFLADIDPALKADETPPRPAPKKPRQTQLRLF